MKTFEEYADFLKCDLYRYGEGIGFKSFLKVLFRKPGFRMTYYMRTCDFIKEKRKRLILLFPFFMINYLLFKHIQVKYGFFFSLGSHISKGFYINHYNMIGIHKDAVVGRNFTMFFGCILAYQGRGKRKGVPTVGDNVFLAAGAKVFGNVNVGSNVLVGPNTVVNFDVPDNAVVMGNPGKIISYKGTEGMVLYRCEEVEEARNNAAKK